MENFDICLFSPRPLDAVAKRHDERKIDGVQIIPQHHLVLIEHSGNHTDEIVWVIISLTSKASDNKLNRSKGSRFLHAATQFSQTTRVIDPFRNCTDIDDDCSAIIINGPFLI